MERKTVDALMDGYRENKARAEFLRVREDELSAILADIKENAAYYATSTTGSYSGMPGGGKVESKVEKIAITLAEGRLPGGLNELNNELYETHAERVRCESAVRCVDAWLRVLNPREYLVITEHRLNGRVWRETAVLFNQVFGEDYSKPGLKAIMERAMERVYKVAR